MNLQYQQALARVKDLRQQADKERLLKPHKLTWRVRTAKVLHTLAQQPGPSETTLEIA
jgi:hypothetical protein